MAKTSAEVAIELRGKFEFYLLALTFSILGLSIQTAEFGKHLLVDTLELGGWVALFMSGVVGILRGEWIPVAYDIQSKITATRERRGEIAEASRRGITMKVPFVDAGRETVLAGEDAVEKLDALVTTLEQQYKATEEKIVSRYRTMMRAFMVGIGCLLIARGMPHALSVAERVMKWSASLPAS